MTTRQELRVPVAGGELAVHRWPGPAGAPILLAVHGISSNGLVWAKVTGKLDGVEVIAPDLRGRGGSRSVGGPYGLARHAEDLVAVLDHLGLTEPVLLAGHSMGAFVACVAAVAFPDRFGYLLLVDGGLTFGVPEGADLDVALEAIIGPSLHKLSMEFASPESYRDFWRAHPSFVDILDADTLAYIDRDLIGEPPRMRSACVAEAIRTDGRDTLGDPATLAAIGKLPVPATLLWATRGMLNGPDGLYNRETVSQLPAGVEAREVPGTNHFSILLGDQGANTIASLVSGKRR